MCNNERFCINCRKDVEYIIEEVDLEKEHKGKKYKFKGKKALCSCCGEELGLPEIMDYNILAFNNAYRVENGIITIAEINNIYKKYKIGKRILSIILGWGELTYTRYCDGDMPTKEYSNKLKLINENPREYLKILDENKTNPKMVEGTYNKSRKAVLTILGEMKNPKINNIASYIIRRCKEISSLALQKALYYVQGFTYAFYHSFAFDTDCEAWVYGPVYRQIYGKYANNKYNLYELEDLDKKIELSSEEKEVVDNVIKYICCYGGDILREMTHLERPWIETRGNIPADEHSSAIIEKELIAEYFIETKKKYNMKQPSDINLYIKERFEEVQS